MKEVWILGYKVRTEVAKMKRNKAAEPNEIVMKLLTN